VATKKTESSCKTEGERRRGRLKNDLVSRRKRGREGFFNLGKKGRRHSGREKVATTRKRETDGNR